MRDLFQTPDFAPFLVGQKVERMGDGLPGPCACQLRPEGVDVFLTLEDPGPEAVERITRRPFSIGLFVNDRIDPRLGFLTVRFPGFGVFAMPVDATYFPVEAPTLTQPDKYGIYSDTVFVYLLDGKDVIRGTRAVQIDQFLAEAFARNLRGQIRVGHTKEQGDAVSKAMQSMFPADRMHDLAYWRTPIACADRPAAGKE